MGAQVRRKRQAYSQPLFGREREEGKDSHSRQWRLSMAAFLNRNKRLQAAPIELAELLLEKPPPSHNFHLFNFFVILFKKGVDKRGKGWYTFVLSARQCGRPTPFQQRTALGGP